MNTAPRNDDGLRDIRKRAAAEEKTGQQIDREYERKSLWLRQVWEASEAIVNVARRKGQVRVERTPKSATDIAKFASNLVTFGGKLRTFDLTNAVDELAGDSDAKSYAIRILQDAVKGDRNSVLTHCNLASKMPSLWIEVCRWLTDGLIRELLNIRTLETPLGWQEEYDQDVSSKSGFVEFLKTEIVVLDQLQRLALPLELDKTLSNVAIALSRSGCSRDQLPKPPSIPAAVGQVIAYLSELIRILESMDVSEQATAQDSKEGEPRTDVQCSILRALDGRALKIEALARECGVSTSRFYKPGGMDELRELGLVRWKSGVGFYRPDALPKQD